MSLPTSAASFVTVPQSVAGQPAAQAAVEYRIGAAIVDNLILLALYGVICVVLHWQFLTLTHQLFFVLLDIAYHFALESRDGQTVGKRFNGVRVVSLDGSRAGPKAIGMRSVLRIIDSLPVWYASGLINMVRTGPARRQRIGDVAAETKVIAVDGRAVTRGTPGWVLPTVTLLALAVSVVDVIAIVNAGNTPLSSAQQASFVAGCEQTSGGVIDCQCLLNRVEADGYTTANSINSFLADARAEQSSNQPGTARSQLVAAALACRQPG